MKIHMRFDDSNREHTHFTIFVNGKNCGQLCMGTEEAVLFHYFLQGGMLKGVDTFVSSGKVHGSKEES